MSDYISHLANDPAGLFTACGEPWQGWQAPKTGPQIDIVVSPMFEPRPHQDRIRQCRACILVANRFVNTDSQTEKSDE